MISITASVRLRAEPVDEYRCKYHADRPIGTGDVRMYTSPNEAADSPVAQALMDVPGIRVVMISGTDVTVVQDGDLPWAALDPQIRYAVNTALGQMGSEAETRAPEVADDDELYSAVAEIFRVQVNPAVAQHGGEVDLIDVEDGVVVVRMMGGCQGCGMANVTLRQGIEAMLKREIPAVKGIRDITDHSAGTKPYFSGAQ